MNCIWIVNGFGNIKSPIGCFAEKIANALQNQGAEVTVESGNTDDYGILKRCLSFQMTRAILRAVRDIGKKKADYVFIEYPFAEYNPFIIPAIWILRWRAYSRGCKIVLSLHEYLRTKKLRKTVTRILIKNADILFVSDELTKQVLQKIAPHCYVRNIFSTISITWKEAEKENRTFDRGFVYFGLVNSSKAFGEMIRAFERFNADGTKHLTVYTSSRISFDDFPEGVDILLERSDEELMAALKKATYCIVPIKPQIELNNSSFIGAVQAGCVIIGHFSNELWNLPFAVNVSNYSIDSFVSGLEKAYSMPTDILRKISQEGIDYGERFGVNGTVEQILEALRNEENPL